MRHKHQQRDNRQKDHVILPYHKVTCGKKERTIISVLKIISLCTVSDGMAEMPHLSELVVSSHPFALSTLDIGCNTNSHPYDVKRNNYQQFIPSVLASWNSYLPREKSRNGFSYHTIFVKVDRNSTKDYATRVESQDSSIFFSSSRGMDANNLGEGWNLNSNRE